MSTLTSSWVPSSLWSTPEDEPPGSTDDEGAGLLLPQPENVSAAAGKATSFLMKVESVGHCSVDRNSFYGAAVAMPQIARSVGWSVTFMALVIRSYLFLGLTILIQGFLIQVMKEEAHFYNAVAGKMHLCNFGDDISKCPDGPNCRGPGGTTYTFQRLRTFVRWSTGAFFRDALKKLFPERGEEIYSAADPGEYGMEDYYCRLVCCLLFIMAVLDDLRTTFEMAHLLCILPTRRDSWIRYELPDWMEKNKAKQLHSWTELNLVKFQVLGMPLSWKLFNAAFVLLPKAYIWLMVTSTGFHFLMDTAGIMDLVVNCMALKFVLDVDKIVFSRLATTATKHILENMRDFPLFDMWLEEQETLQQAVDRLKREEFGQGYYRKVLLVILPKKLIYICCLMAIFTWRYYVTSCDRLEDGSWVSKPIFLPKKMTYNPVSFILSMFWHSEEPVWSMPPD